MHCHNRMFNKGDFNISRPNIFLSSNGACMNAWKNGILISIILFSLFFIASSCLQVVSASPDTIYVNGSCGNDSWDGQNIAWNGSSGPKLSIKNATEVVNSNGTVNIANGVYAGANNTGISINKSIIINGQSQSNTIINGTDTAQIFIIASGVNVTLQNLTLTNGKASDGGGGICNEGNLTITNCTIINNNATHGGGIYNWGGVCTVINSSINNNTAAYLGGGIYNFGTFEVANSDISNNIVDYYGGGICNYQGNCIVTNSTINNNIASHAGGGIYNYQNSNFTVTNSTINDNTALTGGGGIYNNVGTCTVTNSTINSNNGGGIYNQGLCAVINSTIHNNIADNNGGGIFNAGTCEVTNSTISDNTVSNPYMLTLGGGILNYANSVCTITNSAINNNSAQYGGGIFNAGNCTVTNSTISSNIATNGGGINHYYSNLTVTGSTLINNQADMGSAVYTTSSDTLINFNRIFNNTGSYDVYSTVNGVNATNNWWGTNFQGTNPFDAGRVNENVTATPWIVLTINNNDNLILTGENSTAGANLRYNYNGTDYEDTWTVYGNAVPDVNVSFTSTLGNLSILNGTINNGSNATTIFTGTTAGNGTVNAIVDNQTVTTTIQINNRTNLYAGLGNFQFTESITSMTDNVNNLGITPITINAVTPETTSTSQVNAATTTVEMENTGTPINYIAMAIFLIISGLILEKKR